MGIKDPIEFDYMDAPETDKLVAGLRMLYLYGALDADGEITAVHICIYTNRYDTLVAGLRMLYLYGALFGHKLTYADVCYRSGATWRCLCWSLLSRACSYVS
jgi:hypothetical protein